MFSICKQTHPATGIEHSISCNFFNTAEKNLVTGGANILKVYRMIPDVDPNAKEKDKQFTDSRPPKMRLECMATYQLFGNIMSLQSVSLAGSQRDALLISFKEAKLSVVQHDPDTFELKTLSLHYFEEDDIKGGWTGNYHVPIVRVDTDNRCAVMLVYGRKLVVLPFRKDNTLDEIEVQDVKPIKKTPVQLIAKTPILASYIITLKDLDEKIDNVIDFQFLHGYYEPTLLILYEPTRTFPGRVAVRSDTCTMVAISLNIQQRVHPVIWTVTNLPFDCIQVMPINKPIGGCIVFSINAVIYLNQSVPPYGVSLNSTADHSTAFPLKPQDGIKISLDAAQITFIANDKLVLSLKGGELYVLTLCADSMRSVRNFHFSKAASSVLTCSVCVVDEEYLFLGSRLGNSLLIRYTETEQNTVITIDDQETETVKKQTQKEAEDLEVYGTGHKTSVQLTSFTFEVCDSILNIGPIGYMAVGEHMTDDDNEKGPEDQKEDESIDLGIATSSGHGKNGALCVLQNSIKPQIITSFGLSGCLDVWTVADEGKTAKPGIAGSAANDDVTHAFMVLTQESSTMVLQTGEEINEIENTGFCNNLPTIYVGNLGNNRFIVQVTTSSIRLLQGIRQLQNIPIELGCKLTNVSIADPYVCVRAENGQVITLALREARGAPRLAVNKNTISSFPSVVGMSAYRDVSGMFTTRFEDLFDKTGQSGSSLYSSGFGAMKQEPHMKIEDEEDLLYGESGNSFKMTNMVAMAIPSRQYSEWWRRMLQTIKATYWLLVTRDNGNLEIYSMPDLKLVYLISNVGNGNKVLSDSMEFVPQIQKEVVETGGDSDQPSAYNQSAQCFTVPKEILMVGLGHYGSRPLLFIRTGSELLIYRAFRYAKGHLKIRFRKLSHEVLSFYNFQTKSTFGRQQSTNRSFGGHHDDNTDTDMDDEENTQKKRRDNCSQLRYFNNVSGYNGVAVCGTKSYLIFLTSRGEIRIHRLHNNIAMNSFAPFNNVNCPNGFLYFDDSFELKIAICPTYLSLDADWPVRKIPLRCTAGHLAFHKERQVYCLVTDTEDPASHYYRFNGEDKELTEENKGERFLYPSLSKFSVVLVSPTAWEIIPDATIDLDPWEHVTAFKNVSLAYEGTRSGLKEYICIGTNYNYSEDITSRGRILIYDIIEVVPEPGKPLTKFKFKEVYIKEQKGPVSAITHVLGFLVTALGQKIYLWQLKDDDLIGVAFIDTNIYVHEMSSIKSLIFVADVYKSVSLLRFQEEYRTLSLVSRDYHPMNVYGIEYLVDPPNLGFIVTDNESNVIIYMYQPESRESYGGQRLIRKADYHIGQQINAMFRVRCSFKNNETLERRTSFASGYENKHVTFFATLDGGLGYLLPLPEKTYRRLFMLQNVLLTHSAHLGGLNPKAFRTIKQVRKIPCNPSRCIVDGDLLWTFLDLPYVEKQEVAKKIGTKIEEIFSDLLEIDLVTSIF